MKTIKKSKQSDAKWTLAGFILLLIMLIIGFIFSGCSSQKKILQDEELLNYYRMQMVDEAYLKVDYKIDWIESIRVKKFQELLGKRTIITRHDVRWKVFKGENSSPFKIKLNRVSYIPITYEDVNKIKQNLFGKEKMVLSNSIRNANNKRIKIVYQID